MAFVLTGPAEIALAYDDLPAEFTVSFQFSRLTLSQLFFKKNVYLFIFIVSAPGLSCGAWDLRWGVHAGSSSPSRDRTWTPCIGSMESYPLDHQGSPLSQLLTLYLGLLFPLHCVLSLDEFTYSGDFIYQHCLHVQWWLSNQNPWIRTFPWGPKLYYQMTIAFFHFEVYRSSNVTYSKPSLSSSPFFFPAQTCFASYWYIHYLRYQYYSLPVCPSWKIQVCLFFCLPSFSTSDTKFYSF